MEQSFGADTAKLTEGNPAHPLNPGELGVLMARAGVGKTACLTYAALDHIFRGMPVLHVCIDIVPDKIKVWYREMLGNILTSAPEKDASGLRRKIEPLRFILAYLHHTFSPAKLESSLQNLEEQAKFSPSMVVVDGLDFEHTSRNVIEELRDIAKRHSFSIWMSARTHRHISTVNDKGVPYPCNEVDDLFHSILLLDPTPDSIRVKVLKQGGEYRNEPPGVRLNPQTYLPQTG